MQKVPEAQWATGGNPTKLDMFYYAPSGLPPNAPIVVAIHYCLGSATMYQSTSNFIPAAKANNFAVIYPQATHDNRCWAVNTPATLTRGGGGDSDAIIKMVDFVAKKHQSDLKRVFVLGSSSGGMMTNVMVATYPDRFAAAASFSGIPYGCLKGSRGASPMTDSSPCVKGGIKKSGPDWAALVKEGTKGEFKGTYPPIAIWHQTGDPVVNFALEAEQVKQWTAVHGISSTESSKAASNPKAGTTKHIYGDGSKVIAYETSGAGHPHPVNIPEVLKWFGITK
ncbi:PHB depolymerase family esterase [Tothia fuscella]|uniref:Carboxylic ester hydrolase n=1 Tax=Tothia fuscella TaxID=1048955 RepID=A0A9P4TZQ7_9PEZI|nr:PHB depolymerase family esterase [Tothia fuscella]